jgi:cytoskeletal protein CcmA (bactofilin family)
MKSIYGDSVKSDETTIISSGVKIEGTLTTNGNIRVDGEMKGDIISDNSVSVGDSGIVNGQIKAEIISIGGNVTGSVIAKDKLYLKSKSAVNGDLFMKFLIVEEGAKFNGKCNMDSLPPVNIIKEDDKITTVKKL